MDLADPVTAPSVVALERTMEHERVANEVKHWVRLTAACNSRCVFCLDAEAQDGKLLPLEQVEVEIDRGRREKGATRLVISGGEASIHPRFHDAVRFAKKAGYTWVQTVTNGQYFARREFFLDAVAAGLDELTFSLHGHTPELHDRLTRTKNGFENLVKAMLRAVRDGRVVVNVDVCINKQNVEHLEAIVALCARLGVKEFDLLHVIPQGVAFEHRDELFYDPAEHADALRRVFQLARAPGFHVWTNRFPLAFLEGMEELIQDPHKMLDEVGGRRVQFRRYLDEGSPIDCRDPRRCPHCFIEPFCSALDRFVASQHVGGFDVWWVGSRRWEGELPGGARLLGVDAAAAAADPRPRYLRGWSEERLAPGSRVVLETVAQVASWTPQAGVEVELHLDQDLASWLVAHPGRIGVDWILHAPTRATMEESHERDPDWRALFAALPAGVRAANLPACLCPGARLEPALRLFDAGLLHDDGRLAIDPFVEAYIAGAYRVKSLRCRGCAADPWCAGAHVQSIRAHGFRQLQPLPEAVAAFALPRVRAAAPAPDPRLRDGAPPQPGSARVPVAGNAPVPFIDTAPGRRS